MERLEMDRRQLMTAIGATGLAGALGVTPAAAAQGNPVAQLYARSLVIDCLASPNSWNVPYPPPGPLTPDQLRNVHASGITAINLTVGTTELADTVKQIGFWLDQIDRHPETFLLVRRHGDILAAKREGKTGLIFGFQGMGMVGTDMSLVDAFAQIPVKIMQLTYNDRNAIGAGSSIPETEGLSPFGREVVARLNTLGVVIDLAHSNPRTALDASAASKRPIIISHTGCRAIYPSQRNQPDEVLRAVAQGGGVVGIYLMPFLGKDPVSPSRATLLRHIEHAIQVCGEDHVGIGSDQSVTPIDPTPAYMDAVRAIAQQRQAHGIGAKGEADGPVMVPEVNSPRRLEMIAGDMLKAGHSTALVEKVIGGNFDRIFREIWPA
jgi:membrane dipeptidase